MIALKNIVTVFLFLAAAINALQIVLPLAQSTIITGTSFTLQVNTGPLLGETDGTVSVNFINSAGTYNQVVTTGTPLLVTLPSNLLGFVAIVATPITAVGAVAFSSITVNAPFVPPVYNPCYTPCYNPCYTPLPRCNIPAPRCSIPNIPRPRSSCRIRSENSSSQASFEPRIIYGGLSIFVEQAPQEEQLFEEFENTQAEQVEQQSAPIQVEA